MKYGLNLGSGQRPFTTVAECTWVNVDKVERPEMPVPDLVCDATHLPPDYTLFFDYVVLHHILEHFGCGEGAGLIQEAHRVLKPGGSLLVFVPDMRALAERWLQGGISTQIYLTNVYGAYMGNEEDRHKWGFDPTHLRNFLVSQAPWAEAHRFDGRHPPGADIAQDWWILGMECIK